MAPKQVAYVFGVPKERWCDILSEDAIDIHQSTQKFGKGCFRRGPTDSRYAPCGQAYIE